MVLVYDKKFPEAATYRGNAQRVNLLFGSAIFPPTPEQIEAQVVSNAEDAGATVLTLKIYKEEKIPFLYWEFKVELVAYSTSAGLFPAVFIPWIIAGIIALAGLTLIWLITQSVVDIFYGPDGDGGITGLALAIGVVGAIALVGYLMIKSPRARGLAYEYAELPAKAVRRYAPR